MEQFSIIAGDLAWPAAIALAWLAGEFGHRWTGLPRISIYGLAGFILAHTQAGLLPPSRGGDIMLLANVAFGLLLFECGYRVNLKWVRTNPWIGVSSAFESIGTFIAVYAVARWFETPAVMALLLASLAMSTSPAAILRILNEERSSGQVTERILHFSAFSCVLAVFAFKVVVGVWTFQSSGSLWHAISSSVVVLVASAALGAVFGVAVPALLRKLGNLGREATDAFAIAAILLVGVAHALKLSPVLAALTFGFVARHRRVALSQAQRNFGALGDLLTVLLFVFVASTLEWHRIAAGIGLALAIVGVRLVTKTAGVAIFSRLSGLSWRKGMLSGLALAPISVFVILLLEQARYLGVDLVEQLAALAAATLLLEILGPVLTQRALAWAGESHDVTET